MSGLRNGVAKQIMDEETRALYTHWAGFLSGGGGGSIGPPLALPRPFLEK